MVVRRGPLRVTQIANLEGINPTMLSRIVAKLEEARLVTRRADESDGRVVHVAATDEGAALYETIRRQRSDALADALNQLSPDQRRTLSESLSALEALVETLQQPRR